MAAPTQPFTAPKLTSEIVNLSDYIHKPQYTEKFIKTYKDQYGLGMLMNLGMFNKLVAGDTWFWEEDDLFMSTPQIATVVDNTGSVTITYAASSHTDVGRKSYGKVGQTVQFANYLGGRIRSKSTAVDSAHTITVTPIGVTSAGVAITSAQLAAGLVAGQVFCIGSSAFANGSFGQLSSTITTISQFSNQLQTLSEDFTVDYNEMHNETWVKFDFPFEGGVQSRYWLKDAYTTEVSIQRQMMYAVFAEKGGSTTDIDGAAVPLTTGLYTAAERYSTPLPWSGGVLSLSYFNDVENIANKNFVTEGYDVFCGLTATQALQGLKRDYKVNRPDGVAQDVIDSRLTEVKMGSLTYNFIDLQILNDPFTLGRIGSKYKSSMMFVPKGTVMLKDGSESSFFQIRFKPRIRNTKESYLSMATLGYNGEVATSTEDVKKFHYKATIGAEWHSLRQMILATNPQ